MLGKGHAVSGATVWLAGWSWTALAGLAHPHADVLIVGSLVASGAALIPDLDHPSSRIANSGGFATKAIARSVGRFGAAVHARTKLVADRPDGDGHRTITHTFVFAALAGLLTDAPGTLADDATGRTWTGKLTAALLVFALVRLGFAAARAAFPGRRKRVRLRKGGRRWHKQTLAAAGCAVAAGAIIPDRVWWLGVAVAVGCATHCLGDMVTVGGCPILWPLPIPCRMQRRGVPYRTYRTWYLFGIPKWARFRVGSTAETRFTWALIVAGVLAAAALVYAGGWELAG